MRVELDRKHHAKERNTRTRAGFVLPLVLLAMIVVAALSAATSISSWRAVRAARLAWNGERALLGADAAIATAMVNWDANAFAAQDMGDVATHAHTTSDGGHALVRIARMSPLDAIVESRMESRVSGSPDTAAHTASRALRLDVPRLPIPAALTVLGALDASGGVVDGIDRRAGIDGCAALRDTASIADVFADASTPTSTSIVGAPAQLSPPNAATLAALQAQLSGALDTIAARITPSASVVAREIASVDWARAWRPHVIQSADTLSRIVTFTGTSRADGLLVIDGNLRLHGSLHVTGVLVTSGVLDVSAGQLDVDGAVIVGHLGTGAPLSSSVIGAATSVRYSPCAIQHALAAVGRPRTAPYRVWFER